jgi:hypothetical protein
MLAKSAWHRLAACRTSASSTVCRSNVERLTNDLEHVGGCGLLFPCLFQFTG